MAAHLEVEIFHNMMHTVSLFQGHRLCPPTIVFYKTGKIDILKYATLVQPVVDDITVHNTNLYWQNNLLISAVKDRLNKKQCVAW